MLRPFGIHVNIQTISIFSIVLCSDAGISVNKPAGTLGIPGTPFYSFPSWTVQHTWAVPGYGWWSGETKRNGSPRPAPAPHTRWQLCVYTNRQKHTPLFPILMPLFFLWHTRTSDSMSMIGMMSSIGTKGLAVKRWHKGISFLFLSKKFRHDRSVPLFVLALFFSAFFYDHFIMHQQQSELANQKL